MKLRWYQGVEKLVVGDGGCLPGLRPKLPANLVRKSGMHPTRISNELVSPGLL